MSRPPQTVEATPLKRGHIEGHPITAAAVKAKNQAWQTKKFEPISNEHISLQLLEDVPIRIYAIKPLTNPQPPYKDIPYASATWILVFDFNYLDWFRENH